MFGLILLLIARRRVLQVVWIRAASSAGSQSGYAEATTASPCVVPAPCSCPCSTLAGVVGLTHPHIREMLPSTKAATKGSNASPPLLAS
jgi:hypothetical protein